MAVILAASSFIAPSLSNDTTLKFSLVVKDNKDAISDNDAIVSVTAKAEPYVFTSKAEALIYQGDYSGAIQYVDKALAIDPNYKDALDAKGDALNNLGNYTQAIQYADKALGIDPNDKYALSNKGDALYSQGNYTQAIQYYDKALAIDPKYKNALTGKGVLFIA